MSNPLTPYNFRQLQLKQQQAPLLLFFYLFWVIDLSSNYHLSIWRRCLHFAKVCRWSSGDIGWGPVSNRLVEVHTPPQWILSFPCLLSICSNIFCCFKTLLYRCGKQPRSNFPTIETFGWHHVPSMPSLFRPMDKDFRIFTTHLLLNGHHLEENKLWILLSIIF